MQGKWLLSSQLRSTLNHTAWSGCISSPTGSCAKAYIWQAFKARLQNTCWRKWLKILRKRSFILESLFMWDNTLLPRIGSIHQENTTSQHTLAGAWGSATTLPWLWFITLGASKMDKRAGHASTMAAELSRVADPPPPWRMISWTLENHLVLPVDPHESTEAQKRDGRPEHLGAGSRSATTPLRDNSSNKTNQGSMATKYLLSTRRSALW